MSSYDKIIEGLQSLQHQVCDLRDKNFGFEVPEVETGTKIYTASNIQFQDWGIVRNGAVLKIITDKEFGIGRADYDKPMFTHRELVATKREEVNRGNIVYMSTSPDPLFNNLEHVYIILGNQWMVHWDHRGSALLTTELLPYIWKVLM